MFIWDYSLFLWVLAYIFTKVSVGLHAHACTCIWGPTWYKRSSALFFEEGLSSKSGVRSSRSLDDLLSSGIAPISPFQGWSYRHPTIIWQLHGFRKLSLWSAYLYFNLLGYLLNPESILFRASSYFSARRKVKTVAFLQKCSVEAAFAKWSSCASLVLPRCLWSSPVLEHNSRIEVSVAHRGPSPCCVLPSNGNLANSLELRNFCSGCFQRFPCCLFHTLRVWKMSG